MMIIFIIIVLIIVVFGPLWCISRERKDFNNGVCPKCGEQLKNFDMDSQGEGGTTYCNEYLSPSYEDLFKEPPYEDLLKREEWRKKRQEILNRDNHKCVYCGTMYNLQVHHKYYSKYPNGFRVYPWNYPDDALITLCDKCHKKVHEKYTIKTYYRSYSNNY